MNGAWIVDDNILWTTNERSHYKVLKELNLCNKLLEKSLNLIWTQYEKQKKFS